MFSSQQANLRKEVEGFKYTPGTVLVNGRYKQYTEIVSDPDNATYPAVSYTHLTLPTKRIV